MSDARSDLPAPRSPWLMNRENTVLVIIDVQEKLLPVVLDSQTVQRNIERLMDGAALVGIPVLATEQYPKGLGPTVEPLRGRLGEVPEKLSFSCAGCAAFLTQLAATGRTKVLLTGIETHVCVQQTAFDLMAAGWDVLVCVDAVSSRRGIDRATALERMTQCGVAPTTTESALFEWVQAAGTDTFKAISKLVREVP